MPIVPTPVHRRRFAMCAALFGCALSATPSAHAAVVSIDLGPSGYNISGPQGGAPSGSFSSVSNFAGSNSTLIVANNHAGIYGLMFDNYFTIGVTVAGPMQRYSAGGSVSGAGWIDGSTQQTVFRWNASTAESDFGPGSFIGFRYSTNSGTDWNYGYLEVIWASSSNAFEIMSGAYESTVNTAIRPASAWGPVCHGGGGRRRPRHASAAGRRSMGFAIDATPDRWPLLPSGNPHLVVRTYDIAPHSRPIFRAMPCGPSGQSLE